jgi:hypothetical protein
MLLMAFIDELHCRIIAAARVFKIFSLLQIQRAMFYAPLDKCHLALWLLRDSEAAYRILYSSSRP